MFTFRDDPRVGEVIHSFSEAGWVTADRGYGAAAELVVGALGRGR